MLPSCSDNGVVYQAAVALGTQAVGIVTTYQQEEAHRLLTGNFRSSNFSFSSTN